jgi:hypothetical protein
MKFVGRTENIFFPELEFGPIKAKIDTGAYGNSLHVDSVSVGEDGLRFLLEGREFVYTKYDSVVVKSSNGQSQLRYLILLRMCMGEKIYRIKFSLSSRNEMKCPVLIGRRFLRRFEFLVDVRKQNVNDRTKAL